jgi:hypothetical protein
MSGVMPRRTYPIVKLDELGIVEECMTSSKKTGSH